MTSKDGLEQLNPKRSASAADDFHTEERRLLSTFAVTSAADAASAAWPDVNTRCDGLSSRQERGHDLELDGVSKLGTSRQQ